MGQPGKRYSGEHACEHPVGSDRVLTGDSYQTPDGSPVLRPGLRLVGRDEAHSGSPARSVSVVEISHRPGRQAATPAMSR